LSAIFSFRLDDWFKKMRREEKKGEIKGNPTLNGSPTFLPVSASPILKVYLHPNILVRYN